MQSKDLLGEFFWNYYYWLQRSGLASRLYSITPLLNSLPSQKFLELATLLWPFSAAFLRICKKMHYQKQPLWKETTEVYKHDCMMKNQTWQTPSRFKPWSGSTSCSSPNFINDNFSLGLQGLLCQYHITQHRSLCVSGHPENGISHFWSNWNGLFQGS